MGIPNGCFVELDVKGYFGMDRQGERVVAKFFVEGKGYASLGPCC